MKEVWCAKPKHSWEKIFFYPMIRSFLEIMRFPAALFLSLFVPCPEGMLQCAAEEGETPLKQFLVDRKEKEQSRQWVIPIPTFGGLQVWTDFSYRQGYRIQHNAVTDNWRLLDGNDRRWMWGTRGQCEAFLDNVSKHSQSKIRNKHCIVLVLSLIHIWRCRRRG